MRNLAFVIWVLGFMIEMDRDIEFRQAHQLPDFTPGSTLFSFAVWVVIAYLLYERHP